MVLEVGNLFPLTLPYQNMELDMLYYAPLNCETPCVKKKNHNFLVNYLLSEVFGNPEVTATVFPTISWPSCMLDVKQKDSGPKLDHGHDQEAYQFLLTTIF